MDLRAVLRLGARRPLLFQVASNTILQFIGKIISTALSLTTVILLTRLLSREQFGEYNIALAYWGVVGMLADLGMDALFIREFAGRTQVELLGLFRNALGFRILLAGAVFIIGGLVAQILPYSSTVHVGIWLTGLMMVSTVSNVFIDLFYARLDVVPGVINDLIGKGVYLGLVVLVVTPLVPPSLNFLWLAVSVATILGGLYLVAWIERTALPGLISTLGGINIRQVLALASPGLAFAVWSILGTAFYRLDTFLLSLLPLDPYLGMTNAAALGIYSIARKVPENVILTPILVMNSVLPLLAGAAAEDRERFRNMFRRTLIVMSGLGLLTASVMFFLADLLVAILGGQEFQEAALPLKVLSPFVAVTFINSVLYGAIVALDRQRPLISVMPIALIIHLILNYLLVPHYGPVGSALSLTLGYSVLMLGLFAVLVLDWRPAKVFTDNH